MHSRVLPVEARPESIPFPADYADWKREHHNALWGGDVHTMLVGLLRDASADADFMRHLTTQASVSPATNTSRNGAHAVAEQALNHA